MTSTTPIITATTAPTTTSPPTSTAPSSSIAPPLGDFRVYLIGSTGRLDGYLDAASGLFVTRRLTEPNRVRSVRRIDGGQLAVFADNAYLVDSELVGPAARIPHGLQAVSYAQPGDEGRFWVTHQPRVTSGAPEFALVEVDLAGRSHSRVSSPTAFRSATWLQGTEVAIAAGGRMFINNASTGAIRLYASGDLEQIDNGHIVWRSCPTISTCTNYVGTATNPTRYAFTETYYLNDNAVSPDGNYFVLGTETESYLVDLRSGARRSLGSGVISSQAWSSDARWVFLQIGVYDVRAVEIDGDREHTLRFPVPVGGLSAT